jgi:hypothetical protein
MNEQSLVRLLVRKCAETTLRKTAKQMGLSAAYLSSVISGGQRPGPKLLRAMKMRRVIHYIREE